MGRFQGDSLPFQHVSSFFPKIQSVAKGQPFTIESTNTVRTHSTLIGPFRKQHKFNKLVILIISYHTCHTQRKNQAVQRCYMCYMLLRFTKSSPHDPFRGWALCAICFSFRFFFISAAFCMASRTWSPAQRPVDEIKRSAAAGCWGFGYQT